VRALYFLLFIAIGPIGGQAGKEHLSFGDWHCGLGRGWACNEDTEANRMAFIWFKDVRIFGLPPNQRDPLSCEQSFSVFAGNCRGAQIKGRISGNDTIGYINAVIGLAEIEIIRRRVPFKIMRRNPPAEPCGASSTSIIEMSHDRNAEYFVVGGRTMQRIYVATSLGHHSAQLFSSVHLGLIGNNILRINKPISDSGDYDQTEGESGYGFRPSSYVSMGAIFFGCWLAWRSICHFIYSEKKFATLLSASGLLVAVGIIWGGLSLFFC
jgi:hypothetical protein